jgi:hypothetical protein
MAEQEESARRQRVIPLVSLWNCSTLVTDAEVTRVCRALQRQVDEHFAPVWNVTAVIAPSAKTIKPLPGAWIIRIFDRCDESGALGYHSDENNDGVPDGVVGIQDDIDDGVPWSSTASHEVLEMLADPEAIRCIQVGTRVYALEVCDVPEAQSYDIDGVAVSNFVFPSYWSRGKGPWDHLGKLKGPCPLIGPGGYASYATIGNWQQMDAQQRHGRRPGRPWSRHERRVRLAERP